MRKLIMILLLMLISVLTSCSTTGDVVYDEPSDNFINLLNKPMYEEERMLYMGLSDGIIVKSTYDNQYNLFFIEDSMYFYSYDNSINIVHINKFEEAFLENAVYSDLNSFSQLIFDSYCPNEQFYSVIDTISLVDEILDQVVDYKEYVRYNRIEYNAYITTEQLVSDDKLVSLLSVMYGDDFLDSLTSSDEICFKFFSDLNYSYFQTEMYLNINGSNYIKMQV